MASPVNTMTRTERKASMFDGKPSWDIYLTQFAIVSELNRWSFYEKAHLAINLTEDARAVLASLDNEDKCDYSAHCNALSLRFRKEKQAEVARLQFESKAQATEDKLPAFANEVQRLCRLAQPGVNNEMLELLAVKRFVNGLNNADLCK